MPKLVTTETFIEKARVIHGGKYYYDRVVYTTAKSKVQIVCPEHGVFFQTPSDHTNGCGCPKCSAEAKTFTTEEFIKRAKMVHGNTYDYDKVEYVSNHSKVTIVCPKHGLFRQAPSVHLQASGCPKCARDDITLTPETFIQKANAIHCGTYNYDKVKYVNNHTKVTIVCSLHGEFHQTPSNHLKGRGCSKCGVETRTRTTEKFIALSETAHRGKYVYDKVNYVGNNVKVKIKCVKHGYFHQTPKTHLKGGGCPKCAIELRTLSGEEFVEKAKTIHSDRYRYNKVNYINTNTKVKIICPVHGSFLQSPNSHLQGQGCPTCRTSKGELAIKDILDKHNIIYKQQWWYPDESHRYKYDFYLPEQNIIIEFHGKQHYKFMDFFYKSEEEFRQRKEIDEFKADIAKVKLTPLIELKDIPTDHLQKPEFEAMLLHIVQNINTRLRPKFNLHLLVEFDHNGNKYIFKYI